MGIVIEFSHHEGSPGQQEIDLRHTDALTMADNIVTFRYIVKTVAEFNGVHAIFMPSRLPTWTARGCTRTSLCSRTTRMPSTTRTMRSARLQWGRGLQAVVGC